MSPNIDNQQDRLAEIFRQTDNQIIQESKVAFLKIQSWQFAVRTPEIGATYLREAASMITQSLLSFVPNSFVLSEEGYYVNPIGKLESGETDALLQFLFSISQIILFQYIIRHTIPLVGSIAHIAYIFYAISEV